jgi:hypothetical protein
MLLDLDFLRRSKHASHTVAHATPDAAGPTLTRRSLLQIGASAGARLGIGPIGPSLEFRGDSERAAFLLAGTERWVIDPDMFGGEPILRVERRSGAVGLSLEGALFPGTELSADFTGHFELAGRQPRFLFRFALFSGSAEVLAIPWLMNQVQLRGRIARDAQASSRSASDVNLKLSAGAEAGVSPSWHFMFESARSVTIEVPRGVAHASRAVASIQPTASQALADAVGPCTRFTLFRDGDNWQLWQAEPELASGTLHVAGQPFDQLEVECAETGDKIAQVAVVGTCRSREARFLFQPGADYRTPTGAAALLPLIEVTYAIAATGDRSEEIIAAGFAPQPVLLDAAGVCLELAGNATKSGFEWVSINGVTERFICAPELRSYVSPLEDVVSSAVSPEPGTQVQLGSQSHFSSSSIAGALVRGSDGTELILSELIVPVLRPADLLHLVFRLYNLKVCKPFLRKPRLERVVPGDAFVVVEFPPQFLAEEVFPEDSTRESQKAPYPDPRPIRAVLTSPARLAFRLPDEIRQLPFSLNALLSWDEFEPSVVPLARKLADIKEPSKTQSAIELPYHLFVSATKNGRWRHAIEPTATAGAVELWHTRLDEGPSSIPQVVAVWTPDLGATVGMTESLPDTFTGALKPCLGGGTGGVDGNPFRMSLDAKDRSDIVRLSHDESLTPRSIDARLLLLSALGASAELEGLWAKTREIGEAKISTEKVTISVSLSREGRTVVENRGFLLPFGHPATLVRETERRVHEVVREGAKPIYVTYERTHQYIRVKERELHFDTWDMPLTRVKLVEAETPWLDDQMAWVPRQINTCRDESDWLRCCEIDGDKKWDGCPKAFWPLVKGSPFQFTVDATDKSSRAVTFKAAVIFVEDIGLEPHECNAAVGCPVLADSICEYLDKPVSTSDLAAQKLSIARSIELGDTEVEGRAIRFTVALLSEPKEFRPPFRPRLHVVEARVPAAMAMALGADNAVRMTLVDPDQEGNTPEIFATLVRPDLKVAFHDQGDRSGGVIAPTPNVTHLSRRHGPVGVAPQSMAAMASGAPTPLDPASFFDESARFLGQLKLKDLVASFAADVADGTPAMRSILTEWADAPNELNATLNWTAAEAQLRDIDLGFFKLKKRPGKTALSIAGSFTTFPDSSDLRPRFVVAGSMKAFDIDLQFGPAGLVLYVNEARFAVSSDRTTEFSVDIERVDLQGALAFIAALEPFMKSLGERAGVGLDLSPSGLRILLPAIKVPSVTLGVFSMMQLSITTSCLLPFRDAPIEFQFDFGTRGKPCLLAVGPFAGGAFVSIVVTADHNGVKAFAASLEFGAMAAIAFGSVAQGTVYVMGGLYYETELVPKTTSSLAYRAVRYRAYVRLGGQVEALGLVSISVEIYVALEAAESSAESYLIGVATATYSFSIGFVKRSFAITYSKRFAGSEKPNTTLAASLGSSGGTRSGFDSGRGRAGNGRSTQAPWQEGRRPGLRKIGDAALSSNWAYGVGGSQAPGQKSAAATGTALTDFLSADDFVEYWTSFRSDT